MAGLFDLTPRSSKESDSKLLSCTVKKGNPALSVKGVKNIASKIASMKDNIERYLGDERDNFYLICDDDESLKNLEAIKATAIINGYMAIDTETTSLDPITCTIVGISVYTKGCKASYIPLNHKSYIDGRKALNQLSVDFICDWLSELESAKVKFIFFNAKFDIRVIRNQTGAKLTPYYDAYIASRLLNENEPSGGLKALHRKYVLNNQRDAFSFGELFEDVPFDLVPIKSGYLYAANDAKITYDLYEFQLPYLTLGTEENEEQELQGVAKVFWEIEMPIVLAVADMEDVGICVDTDKQKRLSEKYHALRDSTEKEFYDELKKYTSNYYSISSPKQLAELFYDELGFPVGQKRSTDSDTLKSFNHPLCSIILSYREYDKLISTYVDKMAECAIMGRVHGSFNQVGTDTGRFSSNDPNLQNIPSKNAEIRTIFKATDGYMLLSSDYSAQEPKLTACMSGDERMIWEYNNGIDPYVTLASIAYDMPYEQCCEFNPDGTTNVEGKKRRKKAKVILLGITYGAGISTVANGLGVSKEKAEEINKKVFNTYKSLLPFKNESEKMVFEKGYVTTFWGRKRRLPGIFLPEYEFRYIGKDKANEEVPRDIQQKYLRILKTTYGSKKQIFQKANAEGIYVIDNHEKIATAHRQCVNARIQGSAADQTKIAMRIIYNNKRLKELGFRLLIQVHDELIGECPEENVEECSKLFQKCMVDAAKELPIITKTDVTVMKNWDN